MIGQSSGLIDPAGGVAFEVNHPGGWCWGQDEGAAFQVTPDIQGNDRVEIELTAANDGRVFDVPVADIEVLSEAQVGNTVTTVSKVPADVTEDRIEARIIAPDLKDTAVGRRDARATFDGTGDTGYTSSLARDADDNIVATYTFQDAATAEIALAGTSRIMSWAVTTAGGDRLGITIAEHEELGGPGMGGCPLGPNDAQAPAPGNATVTLVGDGTSATVDWTPSTQVAGAPAITGYQVTATDVDGNIVGRNEAATATRSTLTGLPAGDLRFEVRAATGDALSRPFAATLAVPPPDPGGDTTAPALNAPTQAADGSVTLSSPDGTADIYYTADGSAVLDAGAISITAVLYTGPIPVTEADTSDQLHGDRPGRQHLVRLRHVPARRDRHPRPARRPDADLRGRRAGQRLAGLDAGHRRHQLPGGRHPRARRRSAGQHDRPGAAGQRPRRRHRVHVHRQGARHQPGEPGLERPDGNADRGDQPAGGHPGPVPGGP